MPVVLSIVRIKMVYVLNKDGHPLMPTERHARVRRLLKQKKAVVVRTNPFTIRLLYDSTGYVQPVILGIDPGRTNIGLCAVTGQGKPLFAAECRTRNKDIPKLMTKRAGYRRKHRQLKRRARRKRRAKANNTCLKAGMTKRLLPGYKKPVICKDIRNKEARFSNRKRPDGWLTPTANQLLQTHVNLVKMVSKFLPVTSISLELNSFAFMRLDDPSVSGKDFQEGPLKGFDNDVKLAVWHMQDGKCLICGRPIDAYHHVKARYKNGSESVKNRVGLCNACHKKAHTDITFAGKLDTVNNGLRKKYDALGVLNQIIPGLVRRLEAIYPVYLTDGKETKKARIVFDIPKDHYYDAYAIALSGISKPEIRLPGRCYCIRQFRRHDRQACGKEMRNRTYVLDGKTVAVNRHKAFEQTKDSLKEYVLTGGKTERLKVRHGKPVMKNMNRTMPGSRMIYNDKSRILLGCKNHYYEFDDGSKTASMKIKKQYNNNGLVFVSNM